MNILITNDDGIYSPCIAALAAIAKGFGAGRIVAPDVERSGMGHAITHSRPLYYKKSPITFEGIEVYYTSTPPSGSTSLMKPNCSPG